MYVKNKKSVIKDQDRIKRGRCMIISFTDFKMLYPLFDRMKSRVYS